MPTKQIQTAKESVPNLSKFAKYWKPKTLNKLDYWRRPMNRETCVLMTPLEFIQMAFPLANGPNPQKLAGVTKSVGKWDDIPYLSVHVDVEEKNPKAQVYAHDGRHRAYYLLSKKVSQMPVVLATDSLRWGSNPFRPHMLVGEDKKHKMEFPKSIIWDYEEPKKVATSSLVIARLTVVARAYHIIGGTPIGDYDILDELIEELRNDENDFVEEEDIRDLCRETINKIDTGNYTKSLPQDELKQDCQRYIRDTEV